MPSVTFIPNDPLASGGPPPRQVRAVRLPRGDVATLQVRPSAPAGTYQPHTADFDYWQTLAALAIGLRTWKAIDGAPLHRWFGEQKSLPVLTDNGDDLNAFYDRQSLQFFSHTFDGVTVHSCESVDVVCHEQGHGFLDAIRSDFFEVPFIEVGALHEAFGDCVAILAALRDRETREALLAAPGDLSANQFVESLAEELGDAIRREHGLTSVEAGALRHALNSFAWSDPTQLPSRAPADQLAGEVHSFSRVFSGAFYDVIRHVFQAGPRTSAGLLRASTTAGRLLVSALRTVPATPRIFAGVGQRMLQADVMLHAGANAAAIRTAFEAHGMSLAAPATSLPVPLAARTRRGATLELRDRMGVAPDAPLQITTIASDMHGEIAHVTAYRALSLNGEGLEGVQVLVPAMARVARRGTAIVGMLGDVAPADAGSDEQARAFARGLVAAGQVRAAPATVRRASAAVRRLAVVPQPAAGTAPPSASHEIRVIQGRPTLVRVGFAERAG
jgi:hypothetical protein